MSPILLESRPEREELPSPAPADPALSDQPERFPAWLPLLPTLVGLALWWHGIHQVDPSRMNELGLISVLPLTVLLAPALITVGFFLSLAQRRLRAPLLVLHVVALVFTLYGTAGLIEPVPDYKILYRHAGIIDHIVRHGSVDGRIDAYFNWPGFFTFAGFVLEIAGIRSALSLGRLAPVFFELLYLAPLMLLLRPATAQRRLRWLAIWFFYVLNWIGQDYFAPQALAYFTYLTLLAVLVNWFCVPSFRARWANRLRPDVGNRQRRGLMAIVVVVFVALIPSHQLTPFAILAAVALLVVFRQCRSRGLMVLMGVALVGWIAVMTTAYLAGHMNVLTGHIGKVDQTAATNVSERFQGPLLHRRVVEARVLTSGALWVTAAAGYLLRRRRGHRDHVFALLAVAAFPLIAIQPYGGEIVQRAYFFSLPFMAFFLASLFPLKRRGGNFVHGRSMTAAAVVCSLLAVGLFITRSGNQQVFHFTSDEVAAVDALYRLAPPGSLLLGGSDNLPWKATHYADYRYDWVRRPAGPATPSTVADDALRRLRAKSSAPGAFFIITRSQAVDVNTFGALPPGSLSVVESRIKADPTARLVFSNPDARIYDLTPTP
jgi:hypothetical protein